MLIGAGTSPDRHVPRMVRQGHPICVDIFAIHANVFEELNSEDCIDAPIGNRQGNIMPYIGPIQYQQDKLIDNNTYN